MAQASDRLAAYRILVTRILLTERGSLLDQPTQFPYDCAAWGIKVVGYIARVEGTSLQVSECNDPSMHFCNANLLSSNAFRSTPSSLLTFRLSVLDTVRNGQRLGQ